MITLSERIQRLKPSPVRDILHIIDQPGMISFAGGLPAEDSFPTIPWSPIDSGQLQYGASEGEPALRELIAERLTRQGLPTRADHVLILSGSQQGIDLVGKLLVDHGTPVAVESPTYLAALQVFTLLGADYQTFSPDDMSAIVSHAPRLVYTIPTFQNPTGHCYSTAQRQALAQACEVAGSILFEDDPYRGLVYDACDRTPICAQLKNTHWIYQSSFSKTLAPGLRLGYLTASPELFPHLVQLKQAADLHSNRLSQHLVMQLLCDDHEPGRQEEIRRSYAAKRDRFHALLQQHFSDIAQWKLPAGGLFFWLELILPQPVDTRELLKRAIEKNVAFMPGEPFYPDGDAATHRIRLNFSHADAAQSAAGLQVLSKLIRDAAGI